MALIPTDTPDRVAGQGVDVNVLSGWENYGSSADHRALVFHWTASSRNESPSSCVNYCAYGKGYPLYNVLVDRTGVAWFMARERSESSGQISGVALNETLAGNANVDSAASRGLSDTTSNNSALFAISCQNDGVGEPWSEGMVNAMAVVAAVVLETLGLNDVGYLAHHACLTARKVDLSPGTGCPNRQEWWRRINAVLTCAPIHEKSLTEVGVFICFGPGGAALAGPGYWKNLDGEEYDRATQIPGIEVMSVDQRGWDVIGSACMNGKSAPAER